MRTHTMHCTRFAATSLALCVVTLGSSAHADIIELASPTPSQFASFGHSVSGIEDLNGDGHGDFVVGVPSEGVGASPEAGRVYVYSGRTGALIRSHVSPNLKAFGKFGFDVAGIGDLNGDGRGDYLVGASEEHGDGVFRSGRVYVFSGATGALIRSHAMPGAEENAYFGSSLDAVPDLTGDGRPDYIVGAYGATNQFPGGETSGSAYVFSGADGAFVRSFLEPGSALYGRFGWSVAGVPDVNGDGRGDYVVGAPRSDPPFGDNNEGRAYVYSGATGAVLHTLQSPFEEPDGLFGSHVAGVRDLGGNGLGDVVISAAETSGGFEAAGRVYAFSGTLGTLVRTYSPPNPVAFGAFGSGVAGVGDRNGNGFEDLLIGAPGEGIADAGLAYIVDGFTGVLIESPLSPYATTADRLFGQAVCAVPDANGDDLPDYIVAAPADSGAGGLEDEGRAYFYRQLLNDGCGLSVIAIPELTEGLNPFSNIGATGGGSGLGCTGSILQDDVFFTYTATCDGSVTLSTCSGTDFDTIIVAYQGCTLSQPFFLCNLSTVLACDDDGCGVIGGGSTITFDVAIGECYRIRVGGYNGDQGEGVLIVDCVPDCAGDFNGNGIVDASDLSVLLGAWGSSTAGPDIDNNGIVDAGDLATLLGNWGPC